MSLFEIIERGERKLSERREIRNQMEKVLRKISKSVKRGDHYQTASLYQIASNLAHDIGDKRALRFSLESARYNLKIKRYFNAGWSYRNAALISMESKDYASSVNYSLKAIELFSKSNSRFAMQWCYNLAGEASEKNKDFVSALKYYEKSIEIEKGEEIQGRIKNLADKIPKLIFDQTSDRDEVKEEEEIEFKLRLKNGSNSNISEIKIFNKNSKEIGSVESLRPGEEIIISRKIRAKGKEVLSPFERIKWVSEKGKFESPIKPIKVKVIPNVEIIPYTKEKPQVGKQSYFVIMVKNNSKTPVNNVNLQVYFPLELKVQPITGYSIEKILPGDEEGFVFKILPTVVGRTLIKSGIDFEVDGERYEEVGKPFLLEEVLEIPEHVGVKTEPVRALTKEDMDKVKSIQEDKRYINSILRPKPMTEPEYIELRKGLFSVNSGFSLKDVDLKLVFNHILEECKGVYLIGEHTFDNEGLFLFSGESLAERRTYLLKVAVKKENNIVYVAFRLFSNKKEGLENLLTKISSVIKYTITALSLAVEVEKIEVKKIVNIIDSVVQRSKIGGNQNIEENKEIRIKDSVIQRTDL
jgi:hypothetical protein